MGMNGLITMKY